MGNLTKGVEGLLKKNKVTYIKGWAELKGPNDIKVKELNGEDSAVKAKNIVIATGSEVTPLRGIEIDEKK